MPETPAPEWRSLYEAAILETDDVKLLERINAAEAAIRLRLESRDGRPRDEEAQALEDAINNLRMLRNERSDGGS